MSANELFSLILMSLLLIGAAVYISRPLLARQTKDMFRDEFEETPMQHLLLRRDSVYSALKDVEFDYETGKLSDEDYGNLKEKFSVRAAGVLKEIDDLQAGKRRGKKKKSKSKNLFCGACGFKNQKGDKFCQSCGTKLG